MRKLLFAMSAMTTAFAVSAATVDFTGASGGAYGDAANWTAEGGGNRLPGASDTAVIPADKSVSVTAADVARFLEAGDIALGGTLDLVDVTATLATTRLSGSGTFRALGTSATKRTVTFNSDNSAFQGAFVISNVAAVVKSPESVGFQKRNDAGANASIRFFAAPLGVTLSFSGVGDYYGDVTTSTANWYDVYCGVTGGVQRFFGDFNFLSNSHLVANEKSTVEMYGKISGPQVAVMPNKGATLRLMGEVAMTTRLFSDAGSEAGPVEFGEGFDFGTTPYFMYYGLVQRVPVVRFQAANVFVGWNGYYMTGSTSAGNVSGWTTDLNGFDQTLKYLAVNSTSWETPAQTNRMTSASPATLTVTGNLGSTDSNSYGSTYDYDGHVSLELDLPTAMTRAQTLRTLDGHVSGTDGALLVTRAEVSPTTFFAPNLSKIQVGNDFGDDAKTAQLTIGADYADGINHQVTLVVKPHGKVSIAAGQTLTVRNAFRPDGFGLLAGTYHAADIPGGWLTGEGALVVLQDALLLDTDFVWVGGEGKGVADADAWRVNGAIPAAAPGAGATITVADGKELTIATDADVAFMAALREAKVVRPSKIVFTRQTKALGSSVKLSGDGTLAFATGSSEEFVAAYDGLGLTGDILVTNTPFAVTSPRVFGSAKVTNYVSDQGALVFKSTAAGTYANDFDLHGSMAGKWLSSLRVEGGASVTLTGKVRTWGGNTTCFLEASEANSTLVFEGDLCPQLGNVHCRTRNQTSARLFLGDGTADKVFDFGGGLLAADINSGTNVLAATIKNVSLQMNKGVTWRLEVDDPIQSSSSVKSIVSSWASEGGWFDLNGHHLIAGSKTADRWIDNICWKDLNKEAHDVRAGGFCNTASTPATLLIRMMIGGMTDVKPIRFEMNGKLNVEYDGHYAAGAGYDDDGSWTCRLGNYPGKTSTLSGDLVAVRGALHLTPSANYPNVRRLVAKTTGAVYVKSGAQVNAGVSLNVEGAGLVYVAQDMTVSNVYKDGVRVTATPGTYTTDDFSYIKPIDGTSVYTITVTGGGEVAEVGDAKYGSLDAAIDAAGGTETITLLADADFSRTGTFKVKAGGFRLTPAGAPFVRTSTSGDVTTYVVSDTPTFSGGTGTSADPYRVATANDLFELAHWVDTGLKFKGVCFRQTADITWTAADGAFPGIGTYEANLNGLKAFAGDYDGDGRTITGIVFADRKYAGLVNQMTGGTLRNLTMDNASFVGSAASYGGAFFVGNLRNGAALVGLTAKGAFGTAAKPVTHTAAGIVCHASNCTIESCTNEAAIVGSGSKVAGIVGITQNQGDAGTVVIADSVNAAAIRQVNNTTQDGGVAGILGYGWHDTAYGAGGIFIRNCRSTGAVASTFASCHLGSVVGYAYGNIPIVCSGLVVRDDLRTVGAMRVAGGCTGASYATASDGVATLFAPPKTLSGENRWLLLNDAADAFELSDEDGVLDLDVTLGTSFSGTVAYQGAALKKRTQSGHVLYLARKPGLIMVVR